MGRLAEAMTQRQDVEQGDYHLSKVHVRPSESCRDCLDLSDVLHACIVSVGVRTSY